LAGYDYAQAGAYFVTICTAGRRCVLGSIVGTAFQASPPGTLVTAEWQDVPRRFPGVALDAFVVMPNHLHGIVVLEPGAMPPLGAIIRAFKAVTTRRLRTSGVPDFTWQANYYEHIIRNELDLDRVRQYITENPARWADDTENPA
jgi:REP element-mobilizing transposase RayT